jgi:hypothetical protein
MISKLDPRRLRNRVVKPKRGKGRKDRPRKKNWSVGVDSGDDGG